MDEGSTGLRVGDKRRSPDHVWRSYNTGGKGVQVDGDGEVARVENITKTSTTAPSLPRFINPNPNRQEWSNAGKEEEDAIALLEEYRRAGASKNMLPLCWAVDGITTHKPHLCRRTASKGKMYCKKLHASLEEA